jgi:hypothetical protein
MKSRSVVCSSGLALLLPAILGLSHLVSTNQLQRSQFRYRRNARRWQRKFHRCSTYLARGFLDSGGTYFLVDDAAIYLLDRPSGGASFKVWKLAK